MFSWAIFENATPFLFFQHELSVKSFFELNAYWKPPEPAHISVNILYKNCNDVIADVIDVSKRSCGA